MILFSTGIPETVIGEPITELHIVHIMRFGRQLGRYFHIEVESVEASRKHSILESRSVIAGPERKDSGIPVIRTVHTSLRQHVIAIETGARPGNGNACPCRFRPESPVISYIGTVRSEDREPEFLIPDRRPYQIQNRMQRITCPRTQIQFAIRRDCR